MQYQPQISIIVPIYKAEKYINKCINSILTQSFTDFELILINDGSPDNSGKICNEFASKYSKIKVIHKENGGVSSARQCGLEAAIGNYIIHIDPDDWIEDDMLEKLYSKAITDNADMVICDFIYEYTNSHKNIYVKQKPTSLQSNIVLKNLFQHLHGSCCNKLVKRECFNKYNVKFPKDLTFCEDLYVNASLLKNNIKVSYLPYAFYHYVQDINNNSLVKTYSADILKHDIKMSELFLSLLNDHDAYNLCKYNMSFLIVKRAFDSNIYTSKEFKFNFIKYANSILLYRNINYKYKIILYLSCCGFYRPVYNFLKRKNRI